MTRISKRELNKRAWARVHKQFNNAVLNLKNDAQGRSFLDDLLTETETIMLAKRLALIFLLLEKVPQRHIAETLKVSTSTVRIFASTLNRGGFQAVKALFKEQKQCEEFWSEVGSALRFGMPSYVGPRWAWLDELDKKYKIK